MTTLSHQGRCHRMLTRLTQGDALAADLIAATGAHDRRGRSKAWRALDALRAHDLVVWRVGTYALTADGWQALGRLDAGEDVVIAEARPSVRWFGAAA